MYGIWYNVIIPVVCDSFTSLGHEEGGAYARNCHLCKEFENAFGNHTIVFILFVLAVFLSGAIIPKELLICTVAAFCGRLYLTTQATVTKIQSLCSFDFFDIIVFQFN